MEMITWMHWQKIFMEMVDEFAQGKRVQNIKKHVIETWIFNEIKNAILKRN